MKKLRTCSAVTLFQTETAKCRARKEKLVTDQTMHSILLRARRHELAEEIGITPAEGISIGMESMQPSERSVSRSMSLWPWRQTPAVVVGVPIDSPVNEHVVLARAISAPVSRRRAAAERELQNVLNPLYFSFRRRSSEALEHAIRRVAETGGSVPPHVYAELGNRRLQEQKVRREREMRVEEARLREEEYSRLEREWEEENEMQRSYHC